MLSWHELQDPNGTKIDAHHAEMWAFMRAHNMSVDTGGRVRAISNNEIVPQAQRYSPAAHVSYIAGIERAQADSAMLGCWDPCTCDASRGSLNGLLSCVNHGSTHTAPDSHKSPVPTDMWWIAAYYASMSKAAVGGAHLIACKLGGHSLDGLASTRSNATHHLIAGLVGNLDRQATTIHFNIRCGPHCARSRTNVSIVAHRIVPTHGETLGAPIVAVNTSRNAATTGGVIQFELELGPQEACAVELSVELSVPRSSRVVHNADR